MRDHGEEHSVGCHLRGPMSLTWMLVSGCSCRSVGGGGSFFLLSGTEKVVSNEVCMKNLEAMHCILQGWGKRGIRRHLGIIRGLPVAFLVNPLEELHFWSWLVWSYRVSLCKETESGMGSGSRMSGTTSLCFLPRTPSAILPCSSMTSMVGK